MRLSREKNIPHTIPPNATPRTAIRASDSQVMPAEGNTDSLNFDLDYVRTVRGVGYRFVAEPNEAPDTT